MILGEKPGDQSLMPPRLSHMGKFPNGAHVLTALEGMGSRVYWVWRHLRYVMSKELQA